MSDWHGGSDEDRVPNDLLYPLMAIAIVIMLRFLSRFLIPTHAFNYEEAH